MNYLSTKPQAHGHTEEQWQARVDLAAAHRCAVMHNLHEGIFNHLTFRVPGHKDRYYQIPFGLHWSEVNASCFVQFAFFFCSIMRYPVNLQVVFRIPNSRVKNCQRISLPHE